MFKVNYYKRHAEYLEKEIQNLKLLIDSSARFIKEIEKGNLDASIEDISSGDDDDELSTSLISMQEQMLAIRNKETENNWITEGLAEFGDIIRHNSESLKSLSKAVVASICQRVGTNQCGIFIVDDTLENKEERYLNLIACYAYDRHKFRRSQIKIQGDFAEGLIGQVFVEGKKAQIDKIPDDYCYIKTGLGETKPSYILLLPLLYNEICYGVIEITSLENLPVYKTEFLEKLSISLAASIASVLINERTKVLLEDSITQGERLKAQEEEMRQNLEELEATQESMKRKQREMEELASQYEQILEGCVDSVITINQKGTIQFFNKVAEKLWGYQREEVLGKNVKVLMQKQLAVNHDQYLKNYHNTGQAKVIGSGREVEALTKDGNTIPILLTLSEANLDDRTLYTAFIKDITETKRLREKEIEGKEELKASEEALKQKLAELQRTQEETQEKQREIEELASQYEQILEGCVDSVITINQQGTIKYFNHSAEKLWGYDRDEVIGKNVKVLMPNQYADGHDTYLSNYHHTGEAKVIGIGREVEALTKDGRMVSILLTLSEAKLEHESLFTAFIKDQTEQKKLEKSQKVLKVDLDELKGIQKKLNTQTLEMQGVLNAVDASLATIEFTPEGFIIQANENFLAATGYSNEEIKGKHHQVFVTYAERSSEEYHKFWRDLSLGINYQREVKRLDKYGKEIWFSASYTPVFNEDKKVVKIIKLAQDITAQKQQSLDFDSQIKAINRSNLVVEFDLNGRILHANKNFLDKVGYALEEVKGKHHQIFVSDEDQKSDEYQMFWQQLKLGNYLSGEFRRLTKKGEFIWIRGNYNPIFNQSGKAYKIVKYAQDITLQKQLTIKNQRAFIKLREQEETIKVLREMNTSQKREDLLNYENMELIDVMNQSMASVQLDIEGKIVEVNDKFLRLLNYQENELIGQHQKTILDQESLNPNEYQELWQNLKSGKTQQINFIHLKKNQRPIWLNAIFTPILSPKGELIKVIQYANDMSFIRQN